MHSHPGPGATGELIPNAGRCRVIAESSLKSYFRLNRNTAIPSPRPAPSAARQNRAFAVRGATIADSPLSGVDVATRIAEPRVTRIACERPPWAEGFGLSAGSRQAARPIPRIRTSFSFAADRRHCETCGANLRPIRRRRSGGLAGCWVYVAVMPRAARPPSPRLVPPAVRTS